MVRASGIRGYAALMRSLGADPIPLLRRHHIRADALADDDALLSLASVVHLLEASAAETGRGDFGLRLAQNQDIGVLGPLGVVLQNATTVKEALDYATRFLFIHSPGLAISLHGRSPLIEDAVELVYEIRLAGHPSQRQTMDLCLGITHRIAQMLSGEHYPLKTITLPHVPIAPLLTYRRFFGAPVIANQERAALHIDRMMLGASLRGANPALRRITEDYLTHHFRIPGDALSARVRLALRRMLGTPQANKADIAAMLAIHPRTLHRRLALEGTGFEAIRDEVRRELALRYLRETRIPLAQLAGLLGFPEQSALTRSCRRWFGAPPSALRRSVDFAGLTHT